MVIRAMYEYGGFTDAGPLVLGAGRHAGAGLKVSLSLLWLLDVSVPSSCSLRDSSKGKSCSSALSLSPSPTTSITISSMISKPNVIVDIRGFKANTTWQQVGERELFFQRRRKDLYARPISIHKNTIREQSISYFRFSKPQSIYADILLFSQLLAQKSGQDWLCVKVRASSEMSSTICKLSCFPAGRVLVMSRRGTREMFLTNENRAKAPRPKRPIPAIQPVHSHHQHISAKSTRTHQRSIEEIRGKIVWSGIKKFPRKINFTNIA